MNPLTSLHEFRAEVYRVGINPCIDVPSEVSKAFGRRGYIPVKGTLNGFAIRATLVPSGDGRHRLYINNEMRKQAHVDVGDEIHLIMEIDTEPRAITMPMHFAKALKENKEAEAVFEKLPPSHKKEILTYLNWLKKPGTVERNIEKIIAHLLEQRKQDLEGK